MKTVVKPCVFFAVILFALAAFAAQRKSADREEKLVAKAKGIHFVNHIDHAVKVAGINHVGVGTDFDGGGGIPGFNDESEANNVTTELVRRGYNEEQITKIWGGNLLRVWRAVDKTAPK